MRNVLWTLLAWCVEDEPRAQECRQSQEACKGWSTFHGHPLSAQGDLSVFLTPELLRSYICGYKLQWCANLLHEHKETGTHFLAPISQCASIQVLLTLLDAISVPPFLWSLPFSYFHNLLLLDYRPHHNQLGTDYDGCPFRWAAQVGRSHSFHTVVLPIIPYSAFSTHES